MLTKKSLIEGLTMSQLNQTNYSNLKYDNDATKTDSVNKALLDDINAAAKSAGLVATITTARSGHNKNVKGSKRVSRHMNGTGVDVAILNGRGSAGATNGSNGDSEFRKLGFKLKDALVSMGYIWNTESGNDKAVLWHTNTGGNHYNHLHISNRTGQTSKEPTKTDSSDDKDNEEKKDDSKEKETQTKTDSTKPVSGLKSYINFLKTITGEKPTDDSETEDSETEDKKEKEDKDEETTNTSSNVPSVDISNYKITEASSDDKDFYSKVLQKIGAPVSKQNLLFFYAWRQAEGAKATHNPFNTTQKQDDSTLWNCLKKKGGKCVAGVRNYKSKQDGIDATAKTLQNGHYKCILDGLKNDKGATKIAECSSDLKTWGTRDGILRVLNTKKINPPEISKSEVKVVKEGLNEETTRIYDLMKKLL